MTATSLDRPLARATAELPVIAIVREFADAERTLAVTAALISGGVTALEVTTNSSGWQQAVRYARERGVGAVGAGTVRTREHVRQAFECGADFVVSPGTDPEIISDTISLGMDTLPGAMTPTEIGAALHCGALRVKLFPAGSLGLGYFSAIRAPFNEVELIPTGGISRSNAGEWLRAGAWALGMGGFLSIGSPQEIEGRMRELRETLLAEWEGRT
jgi:2-dehydro-3-deoxyphosphogluconate aldolase/(4S)-4-hydroxy-2-oxoglutarate aldolase